MSTERDKALAEAHRHAAAASRRLVELGDKSEAERIELHEAAADLLDPPVPHYTDGLHTDRNGSYWVRHSLDGSYLWRTAKWWRKRSGYAPTLDRLIKNYTEGLAEVEDHD